MTPVSTALKDGAGGGLARVLPVIGTRGPRWIPSRADLIGAILAAVGSLLAAGFSLQLWRAHLHVPLVYSSDGMLTLALVKGVVNGGWVYTNHWLNAPFGLELYDYPLATDNLNYLVIKIIGLGTTDPAKVMNLFFLLTFPAEAVAGYVVLRWLNISVATSVVCAVLFADAPYHLLRGETHLLLSSYVSVPIAAYMVVSILDGRRLWKAKLRPLQLSSVCYRRNVFTFLLCAAIGTLGVYYAIFTIFLVAASAVAAGVRDRGWRQPVHGALIIIAMGGVSFLNDIPTAIYRSHHGVDQQVAHRYPQESEIYALKLAEMVLPVPGHRVRALARLRNRYDTTNPVPSEDGQQALGIVATIGLAWILLIGVAAIVGLRRETAWLARQRRLAFPAIVAFLIGTLGGISALIGYLISPQIRGYDRISIFIAFFALATVGIGLDALGRWFFANRRLWTMLGLGAILAIGIYDQSTTLAVPTYDATGVSYGEDALFVGAIQRILPHDAAVFQLPYMSFPETPSINAMQDYDPLRGYAHSTDLHWSYPAIVGRPQDWASQTQPLPPSTLLDGLVAAGFSGVWIDSFGYADGGRQIDGAIHVLTRAAPLTSRDGRFAFFDLRSYAAQLRASVPAAEIAGLRSAILHPPRTTLGSGFYAPEPDGSRWAVPEATATVDNLSGAGRRLVFYSVVQSLARGLFRLKVSVPGGSIRHFVITNRPHLISFAFTAPAGMHSMQFASNAPVTPALSDPRSLSVHYATPLVAGTAVTPFLFARPGSTPR